MEKNDTLKDTSKIKTRTKHPERTHYFQKQKIQTAVGKNNQAQKAERPVVLQCHCGPSTAMSGWRDSTMTSGNPKITEIYSYFRPRKKCMSTVNCKEKKSNLPSVLRVVMFFDFSGAFLILFS